jgi:hypothetical protein
VFIQFSHTPGHVKKQVWNVWDKWKYSVMYIDICLAVTIKYSGFITPSGTGGDTGWHIDKTFTS